MIRFPFLLIIIVTRKLLKMKIRFLDGLNLSENRGFFRVMMQMSHVTLKKTRKNIKGINDFGLSKGFSPWQTRLRDERGKA